MNIAPRKIAPVLRQALRSPRHDAVLAAARVLAQVIGVRPSLATEIRAALKRVTNLDDYSCDRLAVLMESRGADSEHWNATNNRAPTGIPITISSPAVESPPSDSQTRPVVVTTVGELLDALGSNREILMEPGVYMLDDLPRAQKGLVIENVENLKLIGRRGGGLTRILLDAEKSRASTVLQIVKARNLLLKNLFIGHTDTVFACEGDVLTVRDGQEITMSNVTLYGSGAVGLRLNNVRNATFSDSIIRECSSAIMAIQSSDQIAFKRATLMDNLTYDALISLQDSRNVLFENCAIENNRYHDPNYPVLMSLFRLVASDAILLNSWIVGNSTTYLLRAGKGGRLTTRSSSFQKNRFDSLLSPASDPASMQNIGPLAGEMEGVVTSEQANMPVRQGPGMDHSVIGSVDNGERVTVLWIDGEWYWIHLKNGRFGYVHKNFLIFPEE
jgi:hypothetical protein